MSRRKIQYGPLREDGDLAELLGVILGDGHIGIFPRTDALLIFANTANQGFVERYALLVEKVFNKKPAIRPLRTSNCTRIVLYQKDISKRLGIRKGSRKNYECIVPDWISKNQDYVIRYLRGLYEAEGSFSIHRPTYTHKFSFANNNKFLLSIVANLLKSLGFHPSQGARRVEISRKGEVYRCMELLKFRKYN